MLAAIIVAAGVSRRMGFDKLRSEIAGAPVLIHTVRAFDSSEQVGEIILVASESLGELVRRHSLEKLKKIVPGGAERHLSVWQGLQAVSPEAEFIAVHDGARCLITPEAISFCAAAARQSGAAAAAAPVTDTLKRGDAENRICGHVDRENLWALQTPQIFRREILLTAYEALIARETSATDETSAVTAAGHPVQLVDCRCFNLKITWPHDLEVAERLLASEADPQGA